MELIIVVIADIIVAAVGAAAVGGIWGAVVAAVATFVATIIVYGALIYGVSAMMKRASSMSGADLGAGARGKLSMFRDAVPVHRVTYGRQRLSGPVIFATTTSKSASNKNEYVHMIVALAGNEVASIDEIFFNDELVADAAGTIQSPFTNNVQFEKMLGTSTQVSSAVIQSNLPTYWTADHRLRGIAALYFRLEYRDEVFPHGIPNVSAIVNGKPILDVRDSTTAVSENPALIVRDYLLNEFGVSSTEINTVSFITAANVCDELVASKDGGTEKRYTCNYSYLTSDSPAAIIEQMLTSCYGKLVYSNGEFILKTGAYVTPTITLNENDLRSGMSITTKASITDSYNGVKGVYTDGPSATASYQAADFVAVTSSYYQTTEDAGLQNFTDIQLPATIYHGEARRIAKLNLLDSRQDLSVQFPAKVSAIRLIAGDFVYVDNVRMGWSQKPFEIMGLSVNPDAGVDLSLKETSAVVFDWENVDADVDRDLSPNTNLPTATSNVPYPTNFTATEITNRAEDGTISTQVKLEWDDISNGTIQFVELEFKKSTDGSWSSLGRFSNSAQNYYTVNVLTGITYNFRARNINTAGVPSVWVTANVNMIGTGVAPQAPTIVSWTSTPGSISLQWTNDAVDTDYSGTRIYLNNSSSAGTFSEANYSHMVYGTEWNKRISSTGSLWVWLKNQNTSGLTSSYAGPQEVVLEADVGQSNNYEETRYRYDDFLPSTPTGNDPAGWTVLVPTQSNGNQALFISTATKDASGNVIGVWSIPQRLSGNISFYNGAEPTGSAVVNGDLWYNSGDNYKLYRYNGIGWDFLNKKVYLPDFGTGILPVSYGSALPSLPDSNYPTGSVFFNLTDGNLYRGDGATWNSQISSSLVNGSFPGTQITSGSITTAQILAGSITAGQLQANTITAGQIAAGAITAATIGTNEIIASAANIGNGVITDAKISELGAGKITAGTINVAIQLNAATIIAGTLAVNSQFMNSATPTYTMALQAEASDELGPIDVSTLPTHPTFTYSTTSNLTLVGWGSGAASYNSKRFGQTDLSLEINMCGNSSIVGSSSNYVIFGGAYRINGGSWINVSHDNYCSAALPNIMWSDFSPVTGLISTDTIDIGVRLAKTGTPTGTIGGLSLTVVAPNI